ncbi:hypothetical protein [Clostridium scatologenes]|uniref:Uncharacterized protein n=1 Tax=Clostridium scatologenes TaxID=1548 RepID=A0A0E3M5K0_CLOSL|nr:hypothetical protein [Clostridium scatologenes]AKA68534.1 hypothetical protein CSCA_1409 [Clostridium scatologenes]
MVYEDEIPKELNEGRIYTSKDLMYFVTFHDVKIISEDTSQFYESETEKYKVIKIIEGYVHGSEKGNCYAIPGYKQKIYIVQKAY